MSKLTSKFTLVYQTDICHSMYLCLAQQKKLFLISRVDSVLTAIVFIFNENNINIVHTSVHVRER